MNPAKNGNPRFFEWLAVPFATAWRHRELIQVIVGRELAQRFRGSALGWIWAVVGPLVMLVGYIVVFTGAIKISSAAQTGVGNYGLFIFSGLILFNLFTELIARAPNLMRENAWFLKKTIFPSDTLAWIALIRALIYAAISFVVLLGFQIALTGSIPPSVILVFIVVTPFCLLLLGLVWFLAAFGSLTQDVSHIITSLLPLFIFGSPVFYSVADIPEPIRSFAYLNPLASYIEMMRDVVLRGTWPDPILYIGSFLAAFVVFWGGYAVFMRYRSIVVDVV
jgi:lipopolysaccharide transport system permease protein